MTEFTTLEVAGAIVAAECMLLAWIVPAMILLRQRKRVDDDNAGAEALLKDVDTKQPSREEALSTILQSTYQLEGDELEGVVNEFVEREKAFYQAMTQVYLERDHDGLKKIPEELTKVISPWLRMTPKNSVDASVVQGLEDQNTALQSSLEETKAHMDALMVEYQKAFQPETANDKPAQPESDEPAEQPATQTESQDNDSEAAPDQTENTTAENSGAESSDTAESEAAAETDTAAAPLDSDDIELEFESADEDNESIAGSDEAGGDENGTKASDADSNDASADNGSSSAATTASGDADAPSASQDTQQSSSEADSGADTSADESTTESASASSTRNDDDGETLEVDIAPRMMTHHSARTNWIVCLVTISPILILKMRPTRLRPNQLPDP